MQYLSHIGFFNSKIPFSFGNALLFDGSNDYIEFDSPTGPTTNQNFLASFWFKTTSSSTQAFIGGINQISGCWMIVNSNDIRVFYGNNNYQYTYTLPAFNDGNWHHIMFGRQSDGTTLFFAMDGVDYSAGSTNLQMQMGRLGANQILARPFSGTMDEFVLAYEAPSLVKAQAAYNGGLGNSVNNWLSGSAEIIYHMNESDTDIVAIDDSGNGNDGNLNNFIGTYWVTH